MKNQTEKNIENEMGTPLHRGYDMWGGCHVGAWIINLPN